MTTKLSKISEGLSSLAISKISEGINARIKQGEQIYNFTLGDFAPKYFSIPEGLEHSIIKAYEEKRTNYSFVGGIEELRYAIAEYIKFYGGFIYQPEEVIVGSGARPLTYLVFRTILDAGDKVINPVPSWNNYNYIHLAQANAINIETKPENGFMLTAQDLKPYIQEANLLIINSPLNPSGTMYTQEQLKEVIDLVVEENKRRVGKKPLYVFFDMIYWRLTYGSAKHFNPIALNLEIRDYIIFIDGISKCFAATGVRVGWAFGPKEIIAKMREIIAHVGAWAGQPEQVGTAKFLSGYREINSYMENSKQELSGRLNIFYDLFKQLKNEGYKVDVIEPQGAIYLSLKLDFFGMKTAKGIINTVDDIALFLIEQAKIALVPFYAFGAAKDMPWFRLSVGACSKQDAYNAAECLQKAIKGKIG